MMRLLRVRLPSLATAASPSMIDVKCERTHRPTDPDPDDDDDEQQRRRRTTS
jgi:hypothetical protein